MHEGKVFKIILSYPFPLQSSISTVLNLLYGLSIQNKGINMCRLLHVACCKAYVLLSEFVDQKWVGGREAGKGGRRGKDGVGN